ncbi:MAG TPA: MBL fold metallo-hydrolase [Rhizomicrobium sp.]|nr:MBL fold metallo-hydrolase [Rhizomicrobium sp.]
MTIELTFLGGAGTVTGSKYLLQAGNQRILVDCGLFQGLKSLRLKNWARFPVDPQSISAVVLTHAHIDHSGYLPLLAKHGFRGPIFCTAATKDLCGIMLPDAAHLQEKDAEFANRHGFSKHRPALPLYGIEDADRALRLLHPAGFDRSTEIASGASVVFRHAGHILGAASIELVWNGTKIVFSGDIGRYADPLMFDPVTPASADYLLVESTYGDRLHASANVEDTLTAMIGNTIGRGGTLIVPAFAVGRAQLLLYYLHQLKAHGRISATLPLYLDSPMAIDTSDVFSAHPADHRLSPAETRAMFAAVHYVREAAESKALTADPSPKVIISASGMATGGRVLHHLRHYAPESKNTILFAGYQAAGTRGAAMVDGAETVKIFGGYVPVRAEVHNLDALSAHADQNELMRWLRNVHGAPKITFVTHGEPVAADALRHRIEEELHWTCVVAEQNQKVLLQ